MGIITKKRHLSTDRYRLFSAVAIYTYARPSYFFKYNHAAVLMLQLLRKQHASLARRDYSTKSLIFNGLTK